MMQRITTDDGVDIAVEQSGNPDGAPLVLVHALGVDHTIWDLVAAPMRATRRIIAIDLAGHGVSEVRPSTAEQPQTLERLAMDVEQVVAALGIERADYAGISIGGMVGQVLGVRNPAWLRSLTLVCTASSMPAEAHALWDERIATVRDQGMDALVDATLARWFTTEFARLAPSALDQVAAIIRTTPTDGFIAACEAIKGLNMTPHLGGITVPTLVISGAQDASCPPEAGRAIAAAIPGARFECLDPAAHMPPIEAADRLWPLIDGHCA
ncbi:alpha/beta fold hydrolase [Tistrella sp. BH-R2-4]|uniref:Alpha/beta fold hydrolase n=1 Tax=Tistrella arctica TaxID=3133430 RepID=A0ABU9YJG2_9PROT